MAKYECEQSLCVEIYDAHGVITKDTMLIRKGEVWEKAETEYRFCGGKDSIRLEQGYKWIEISKESFDYHFRRVEDGRE